VSGAKREATRQHLASALPTAREQTITAGRKVKEPTAVLFRWLSTNKRRTPITPIVLETRDPTTRSGDALSRGRGEA